VESEIDTAFNQGKIIIPFRIEDTPMSPELSYYLNENHRIDGIPTPADAFARLKDSVIQNIPRLQKDRAREHALNLLKEELGDVGLSELQEVWKAVRASRSIDERIRSDAADFEYELLTNKQGEVLLKLRARKGMPLKARLVCDGSPTLLRYRNKDSSVLLHDVNGEAIEAVMKIERIFVAEIDDKTDEAVRECEAPVRFVRSLESILNG